MDPALVYKTIVITRTSGKPILAVIPGPNRVDLKLLAAALGEKKVTLPTEREAEALTGLQAGGISPLALVGKGFQVLIDSAAQTPSDPYQRRAARAEYTLARPVAGGTDACPVRPDQPSRGGETLIGISIGRKY